jgi:hypothetical protein
MDSTSQLTTAEALAVAVEWLERSRDSKSPSLAQVHATVLLERLAELEEERDEYLSQRNLDYKRFSEAKQALIAAESRIAAYERVVEAAEKADFALNAKWPLYEPVRKLGDALAALRVLEGEER